MAETTSENGTPFQLLCSAVGYLFLMFARLETSLSIMLKMHLTDRLAGRKADIEAFRLAAAIYGSMRLGTSRDTIKRLAVELEFSADAIKFLTDCFAHVGHIADLRDKLAHQQLLEAENDDHSWLISDSATTRVVLSRKIYKIKTASILLAAQDAVLAGSRLSGFLNLKRAKKPFDLTPPAWRYKQGMLELQPRRTSTSRG